MLKRLGAWLRRLITAHPRSAGVGVMALAGVSVYIGTATIPAPPAEEGTANLWMDADGGTCARQGTPAAYSSATACDTFEEAWGAATAGDTVGLKGGSYTGAEGSLTDVTDKAGTTRVTYMVADGEAASFSTQLEYDNVDDVTIDGSEGASGQGIRVVADDPGGSFLTMGFQSSGPTVNLTFRGAYMGENTVGVGQAILLANCQNILIEDVEIRDLFSGDGIHMTNNGGVTSGDICDGVTFDNVDMYNVFCTTNSEDHQDHIQILTGANTVVKNGEWIGASCSGAATGFQGWFISGGFQEGPNHTLENMVIADITGGPAIAVYRNSGIVMRNNTIDGSINTESTPQPPEEVTFRNNIVSSTSCTAIDILFDLRATGGYGNNVLGGACGNGNGDAQWTGSFGDMFVDEPGDDFHLMAGSFAIGKASQSDFPATDIDGESRPQGATVDAGADDRG